MRRPWTISTKFNLLAGEEEQTRRLQLMDKSCSRHTWQVSKIPSLGLRNRRALINSSRSDAINTYTLSLSHMTE